MPAGVLRVKCHGRVSAAASRPRIIVKEARENGKGTTSRTVVHLKAYTAGDRYCTQHSDFQAIWSFGCQSPRCVNLVCSSATLDPARLANPRLNAGAHKCRGRSEGERGSIGGNLSGQGRTWNNNLPVTWLSTSWRHGLGPSGPGPWDES